jgi:hypothetical protein
VPSRTRAPSGCPRSVASPQKAGSHSILSARTCDDTFSRFPDSILVTLPDSRAIAHHVCEKLEVGERLKSPSQSWRRGSGAKRCFSGSRGPARLYRVLTEGTPEGRRAKRGFSGTLPPASDRHWTLGLLESRVDQEGGRLEWGEPSEGVGFQPRKALPIRGGRLAKSQPHSP